MNDKAAMKQIAAGNHASVYVCYGTERYLIDQFIQYITTHFITPENMEYAVSRYDLRETPVEVCLEDAETLPFLAEKKVIIAERATFLTASREKNKVEHNLNRLIDYLKKPTEFTILLLIVETEKLDERKKIVKQLRKNQAVIQFLPMDAQALRQWVMNQAEKLNCELKLSAAEALLMHVGTDLQLLAAELEKLSLYAGEKRTITKEMIENLTVRSVEQNIFVMVEEMVNQNLERALSIYYDLLNRREEPVKILMLIARQFRMIMQVKELRKHGYTNRQMASQLGLHPYAVQVASNQGRRYSQHQLHQMINKLAEVDYGMKTGKLDKKLAIELVMMAHTSMI